MQAEWRGGAAAPPPQWSFPVDEFSAAEEDEDGDEDELQYGTTADDNENKKEDKNTEPEPDPEPTGDPFLKLGAQVRDAARNGDAPPRFDRK